jgi:hypothetical protein
MGRIKLNVMVYVISRRRSSRVYSLAQEYSFMLEAESPQGHSAAGRIRQIEKSNDLIGNRTGYRVPQLLNKLIDFHENIYQRHVIAEASTF